MAAALREAGFDPDRLAEAELDPAGVHALVELHIEQGAVLEEGGESIGVVTAIAAPHDFRLTLRGAATHAGATPMRLRRDALAGAAEAITRARADRARVAQRDDGRHGRRAARAAGRDQRRARRGRARRRRARLRPAARARRSWTRCSRPRARSPRAAGSSSRSRRSSRTSPVACEPRVVDGRRGRGARARTCRSGA